jgi:hypothetical protein
MRELDLISGVARSEFRMALSPWNERNVEAAIWQTGRIECGFGKQSPLRSRNDGTRPRPAGTENLEHFNGFLSHSKRIISHAPASREFVVIAQEITMENEMKRSRERSLRASRRKSEDNSVPYHHLENQQRSEIPKLTKWGMNSCAYHGIQVSQQVSGSTFLGRGILCRQTF